MKNKFMLVAFALFFLGRIVAFAQATSNKGTDFWIAYAGHVDALGSRMTLFLSSDVSTTYQVTSKGSVIASGNITANVVTPVFIDPNEHDVHIGTSDVVEVNKGINVTSGEPISVYCVISNSARTGSSLVLPTATLERQYYVFSQQNGNNNASVFSEFTIVGVKDNTTIDIKPKQASKDGARVAGVAFQITLNKGDVYQYQAVNDLTGSEIKATGCTPIAVFSGNTWAAYCEPGNPKAASGGDNLFQQLFPVTAWGRNFVSAPFYNTLHGNTDIIKIIVSEDNTTVTVNGSTTSANGAALHNPYVKGSVITFYSTSPNIIKGSSPIAVAQYQTSQTCNPNNASGSGLYQGDPEMTILNPIEQTLKDITVYSRLNSVSGVSTNIYKYFLNIIIKTADIPGFTLDGAAISSQFNAIADGEYSYAVVNVSNSSDQHRLIASGGFVAIAYGYGQVESYAYLAGTDLKNLKSNIQVYAKGGSISAANFCLGTDFDFVLKLPYVTNKLSWVFNNGAKTEVIDAPPYTTTVEDGQTFYLYKYALLPTDFTAPGSYQLKVQVEKEAGAICLADEEIFTNFDIFSPDFLVPTVACENTDVLFTDASPRTGGNINVWHWDFGDGATSDLQNPKHKFSSKGTKTITLNVTTDLGCSLSVVKTIDILMAPRSAFTVSGPFCVNSNIQFNNNSTFVNSDIANRIWDFGNGQPFSSANSPTVTYNTPGDYTVKLISISSSGCADTVSRVITIYDVPEISFDDPGSCVNDVVQFNANIVKGNITSWHWDFGDGSNDVVQNVLQNPTHRYMAAGNYTVTLVGTSSDACSVTFTKQVVISSSNPNLMFEVKNAASLCANVEVSFENKSTIAFGSINKIEWIFDYRVGGVNKVVTDDNPVAGETYMHKYPSLSTKADYVVLMRAYTGQTCVTESAPVTVTVYPAPRLKVNAVDPVCESDNPFQLVVEEQNLVPGSYVYSGTGVSSTGIFSPRISGAGIFNVKYVYTTDKGCTEEENFSITVNKLPDVVMPAPANILLGGKKQFEIQATGSNLSYKWSPSTGLSADNVLNPIASPEKTTRYTLTITTNSCESVYEYLVTVHNLPLIPNVFSPNADGKNDTWNIKYLESYKDGRITIFNRYGQKVFEASTSSTPWDGRYNGADLPVGVYYYIIEPNNGIKRYTGSVTILR